MKLLRNALLWTLSALLMVSGLYAPAIAAEAPPTEVSFFISAGSTFQYENNEVLAALEEFSNTKISFEIPPQSNYQERLQILFAMNELPDVVFIDGPTNATFVSAVTDGLILGIGDAVKAAPNLMAHTNPISWESMDILKDGEIYGIPRNTLNRADGYAIREDWLEKVGLTIPEDGIITVDEFTEILRRFTEEDPDGNGKDDTYGLSLSVQDDGALKPILLSTFGEIGWQDFEGEAYPYMNLMYSKTSSAFKDAMEYTAMLWEKGYIDPNWPNNKSGLNETRFKQGIAGGFYAFANFSAHLLELEQNFPGARMTYITRIVKSKGDAPLATGFGTGMWGMHAITSAAEGKLDAVVGVFDTMLSDEYWPTLRDGVEGLYFTRDESGAVNYVEPYNVMDTWRSGLLMVRRYLDADCFIPVGGIEPTLRGRILDWTETCASQMVMSKDRGYRPAVADDFAYIDYQKTFNQGVSKIIVGSAPLSDYDGLLDGWYKAGGETYMEQMNAYIASVEK